MLTRALIKRMPKEEKNFLRDGALYTGMATGFIGYFAYRKHIK